MAIHNIKHIWKKYIAADRKRTTAGFTLPELVVGMAVAGLGVYAVLALLVSLLGTEKRETAKSQTQQEMALALDYIASEIQEAEYIYPDATDLQGNVVPNDPNITPVLAFWKLEEVPYRTNPSADEDLPADCSSFSSDRQSECTALKTSRHSYTLVIYSIKQDSGGLWEGPAQITRFQLRKYKADELSTLTPTDGYRDPRDAGFNWTPSTAIDFSGNAALVDSVDYGSQPPSDGYCPADYNQSPSTLPNNNGEDIDSFYACVRDPQAVGNQDAVIFIRGNAAQQAGAAGSRNPVYLPSLQTRVQARSQSDILPLPLGQ